MHPALQEQQQPLPFPQSTPQTTKTRYVFVPDQLISAFAHDPLAVGIYVAVARFTWATKSPVPLAAADLAAWNAQDNERSRAAIMRRIVRLEEAGWLQITRTPSAKSQILPTWGRDGMGRARPWQLDQEGNGKPAHLRGRRVPLALLDVCVGRLDPQPGRRAALISRYFTQPLIDLADIGAYAVCLLAEREPTPRLQRLGLADVTGAHPIDELDLLTRALDGALTTTIGGSPLPIALTAHGYGRLHLTPPEGLGPDSRSNSRSNSRSTDTKGTNTELPASRQLKTLSDNEQCGNTWDVGIHEESTKDSSTRTVIPCDGDSSMLHFQLPEEHILEARSSRTLLNNIALDPDVMYSHQMLNPHRPILPGEWQELLALQNEHGVERLCIWQARAARAIHTTKAHQQWITPGYYAACASNAAFDTFSPKRRSVPVAQVDNLPPTLDTPLSPPVAQVGNLPHNAQSLENTPDPERVALLKNMGICAQEKLAYVPLALLQQWHAIINHPGLAARFDSPAGFAVKQLIRGFAPPSLKTLERWANHAAQLLPSVNEPAVFTEEALARYEWINAHAQEIAPPDAAPDEIDWLKIFLEGGATDETALIQLTVLRIAPPDANRLERELLELCLHEGATDEEALAELDAMRRARRVKGYSFTGGTDSSGDKMMT